MPEVRVYHIPSSYADVANDAMRISLLFMYFCNQITLCHNY